MSVSALAAELPLPLHPSQSHSFSWALISWGRDVQPRCHLSGSHLCEDHGMGGASSWRFFLVFKIWTLCLTGAIFFSSHLEMGAFVFPTLEGTRVIAQLSSTARVASTETSLCRKNYGSKWTPSWCACIKEFWKIIWVWEFFLLLLFYNQRKRHPHFPSEKLEFS